MVFPQRELEVDSRFSFENKRQWNLAFNKTRDRIGATFTSPETYNGNAGYRILVDDSDSFKGRYIRSDVSIEIDSNAAILCAVLARELSGRFAGLDLSIQPLMVDVSYSDTIDAQIGGARRLHQFILYQAYGHLSESTGHTILK
mgnify:CR=1 FL=1